jgi:hypothetical protein
MSVHNFHTLQKIDARASAAILKTKAAVFVETNHPHTSIEKCRDFSRYLIAQVRNIFPNIEYISATDYGLQNVTDRIVFFAAKNCRRLMQFVKTFSAVKGAHLLSRKNISPFISKLQLTFHDSTMNRMALSNLKNQRTRVRSVVIKC